MSTLSVGDELTFDRVLASLNEFDRASVERVLNANGFRARLSHEDLVSARSEGRADGYRAGFADGKNSVEQKAS